MNSLQEEVYQAVKDRGYLDTERWSRDQLVVRQIVKIGEELGESAEHVSVHRNNNLHQLLLDYADAGKGAKSVFNHGLFDGLSVNKDDMKEEVADIQVVVYVLATLLGIDSGEEARKKATRDAPRGITC
jgi:NTP pyrophosphatase (non-canonical NTP hydrolase)